MKEGGSKEGGRSKESLIKYERKILKDKAKREGKKCVVMASFVSA